MKKSNFFNANIVYFVFVLCFVAIRIISSFDLLSFFGEYDDLVYSILIQIVSMLCLSVFLFGKLSKQKPKQVLKSFGVKKLSLSALCITILIGIIAYLLNSCISSFFYTIIQFLGYEKLPSVYTSTSSSSYTVLAFVIDLFASALLPGICEEIMHRGMLLKSYQGLGLKKAIFFSGLLFGLTHLNIQQFFYASIIGFFFGFVTALSGNILPAMIMHFLNNAIGITFDFLLANSNTFKNYYNAFFLKLRSANVFVFICTSFVIIMLVLAVLVFLTYRLFKHTAVKEIQDIAEQESKKQLRAELMGEKLPEPVLDEQMPMVVQHNNKYFNIYVPIESMGFPIKQSYVPNTKEKAVFYGMLTVTTLITIFTFVWGAI